MARLKKSYWVTTSLITVQETNQQFKYGDEFPDLEDERRTDRLLEANMISTKKPTDIPIPIIPETNHFEPSQPYVKPAGKAKTNSTKKTEKEK